MRKIIIAAVSLNDIVGVNNKIPWAGKYKGDLKRFKELTENNIVIMGRKTWDSIDRKALPNRRNIVLSRNTFSDTLSVETFQSVKDALDTCDETKTVYFIGGANLYCMTLGYADEIDLTIIPEFVTYAHDDDVARFPIINTDVFIQRKPFTHPYNELLMVKRYFRNSTNL